MTYLRIKLMSLKTCICINYNKILRIIEPLIFINPNFVVLISLKHSNKFHLNDKIFDPCFL